MVPPSNRIARDWAEYSVLGCLAVIPFCLGGAAPWALWPLAILTGTASICALLSHRKRLSPPLPSASLIFLFALLCCLVQLIPLPNQILRLISPPAAELGEFALRPLGLSATRSITLDPPATWNEVSKHASYLLCFVVISCLAHRRRFRKRVLSTVALTGLAVAIIGYVHLLAGTDRLFGLLAFSQASPPIITPFGNPNHLAAYLSTSGTVCLPLALTAKRRRVVIGWGLAYIVLGSCICLSLSVGGIVAFFIGQLSLAFILFRVARAKANRFRSTVSRNQGRFIGTGLLAILCIACFVSYDRLTEELGVVRSFENFSRSKVRLWPEIVDAARSYRWAGMGRGTFQFGFARFQKSSPNVLFTHAENWPLHLWSEFGPVASAGLILFTMLLIGRTLAGRRLTAGDWSICCALGSLAIHDLFDFSLELPACAATAVALLGVLLRTEPRPSIAQSREGVDVRRALVAGGSLVLLSFVGIVFGRRSAEQAENDLRSRALSAIPMKQFLDHAWVALNEHPADHLIYSTIGSVMATRQQPREALAYVNRALFLRPADAQAHLVAARALLQLGARSQAFEEYRRANEIEPSLLDESLGLAEDISEIILLSPRKPRDSIRIAERLFRQRRVSDALEYLSHGIATLTEQENYQELLTFAADAYRDRNDLTMATTLTERALRYNSEDERALSLKAQLLWNTNQKAEALHLSQSAFEKHPASWELAMTLAKLRLSNKQPSASLEVISHALVFVADSRLRAALFDLQGQSLVQENKLAHALEAFESAAALQPDFAQRHYAVALMLERLSRYREASFAVARGLKVEGGSSEDAKRWLVQLQQRSVSEPDVLRNLALSFKDAGVEEFGDRVH